MHQVKAPGFTDYALLVLLAMIWGGSFFLIKIAVATIPAVPMTALRLAVAAVTLIIIALPGFSRVPGGRRTWLLLLGAAFFGNVLPFGLIAWGEETVDSGLAAILMAVMPLATMVLAHYFTRDEKLNRWKLAGVLLGVVGLVVLMGPDNLAKLGSDVMRQFAIALAAVCYGIVSLIVRQLSHVPQRTMTALVMILSALLIAPFGAFAVFSSSAPIVPSTTGLFATIVLGILQTGLATLLAYFIIRRLGATFFAQLNFMVPLFGVFFGMVILSENPGLNAFVALGIIFVGLTLARIGILKVNR